MICYMPLGRHKRERQWVYDDSVAVKGNPLVVDAQGTPVSELWRRDFWGRLPITSSISHKSYRPLTTLSYRLEWGLRGDSPDGFHSTNVALHVLSTLLCIPVALALQRRHLLRCPPRHGGGWHSLTESEDNHPLARQRFVAAATAVLFATHPVHAEAVSNVTGRAEILMHIVVMSGFLAYLVSSEPQASTDDESGSLEQSFTQDRVQWKNWWWDVTRCSIAAIFAFMAMLCKESGVVLPLVCAAWELARYHTKGTRNFISSISPMNPTTGGENSFNRLVLRLALLVCFSVGLVIWRVRLNEGSAPEFFFNANRVAHMGKSSIAALSPALATLRPIDLLWLRRLNVANLWLEHLLVLCWPVRLSVDWGADSIPLVESFTSTRALILLSSGACLGIIVLATVADAITAAYKSRRRQVGPIQGAKPQAMMSSLAVLRPELRHGCAFLVLTFAPCGNLYTFVGATKAERWLYLPSYGFCFIIAILIADTTERLFARRDTSVAADLCDGGDIKCNSKSTKGGVSVVPIKDSITIELNNPGLTRSSRQRREGRQVAWIFTVAVAAMCGVRTAERDRDWGSNLLLWQRALEVTPNNIQVSYIVWNESRVPVS